MHVQMTQNNKFAISLQYLKEELSGEVGFLHAEKHESFLQIDNMIFDRDDQALPKFSRKQVCNVFTISQKKKLEMKSIFWMQINIKVFSKLISIL